MANKTLPVVATASLSKSYVVSLSPFFSNLAIQAFFQSIKLNHRCFSLPVECCFPGSFSSFRSHFKYHALREPLIPKPKEPHSPYILLSIHFFLVRAASTAHGSSQARGRIGAAAASLRCSHSNARSEPHL